MTKALGLDDAFAFIALPIILAQSSLEIREVSNGAGQEMANLSSEQLDKFFSLLPTMQLLYFAGTGFIRLSIVAFLPRLSKERNILRISWALGAAVVTMSTVCFFIMLFECKHIPDLWNKTAPGRQCLSSQHEAYMFWIHGSLGLAIDIILLALPMWIIYSHMMFSAATKRVLLIFSVGFFVVITGAIRLGLIVTVNFAVNTTYILIRTSVWTDLEGHVGFWVACFPTLQPLLRIIVRQLGLSSKNKSTTKPNPSSDLRYRNQSTWNRIQHDGSKTVSREDSLKDDASGKAIVRYEERELGLELGSLGVVGVGKNIARNEAGILMTRDVEIYRE